MNRWLLGFVAAVLGTLMIESARQNTAMLARADPPATKQIRFGVYDPRAVAVAYGRSQAFRRQLNEKQKEMEIAKAAQDQDKIKELQAWGQDGQMRLHLQAFAGAPVDDILAQVKDQLPKVADAANVQVISLPPDYTNPDVEIVDITDDLVKLWSPDARALKIIADLRRTAPLPIEQIAKMGPND